MDTIYASNARPFARYRKKRRLVDIEAARRIENFATRLSRIARTASRRHPLSSAQYSAMALLSVRPRMPVVELARLEGVAHPTMSKLASGLVKAGFVSRTKDEEDNRSSLLTLTVKGERVYQEVADRRVKMFEMMLAQLSPGAIQEFLELITRSTEPMENMLRSTEREGT
jgi:DNA-binding MarR family transcriptional regulator